MATDSPLMLLSWWSFDDKYHVVIDRLPGMFNDRVVTYRRHLADVCVAPRVDTSIHSVIEGWRVLTRGVHIRAIHSHVVCLKR